MPPKRSATSKTPEASGHHVSVQAEIDRVVRQFDLPARWPEAAVREAGAVAGRAGFEPSAHRRDLRDKPFVTIDGEDAKDFDDAILLEEDGAEMRLSVAIADVAFYVAPGGALDREAYRRGNSVYFSGRVIPMLPAVLSDDLCSLRPDEDRLALVCTMRLSHDGEVGDCEFLPAVIRSHARLTYREAGAFLGNRAALAKAPAGVAAMLRRAHRAWRILDAARLRRGALDLDVPDARVAFDAQGRPQSIVPFKRNDAHRLIEEFMICANVAAARFLSRRKAAYLRRVHQGLKADGRDRLNAFLRAEGFALRGETTRDFAALFAKIRGHRCEQLIHGAILQSLARAVYAPLDTGHFGLALSRYAHFTSPIRRYPDLLVHRAIHAVLGSSAGCAGEEEELRAIGEHCSETEKRADDATRDIDFHLKCRILQSEVGKDFNAVAVGVTNFGLFMELEGMYASGLLHISRIGDDYYHFNDADQSLEGERDGAIYRLGTQMKVTIRRVDPDKREIDLVPAGNGRRRRRNKH